MTYGMRTSIVVAILASLSAYAQTGRACKSNPDVVGKCFVVHGRVMYTNGTPSLRIWRVGSKRMLGILPPEDEIIPENLKVSLAGFNKWVYADLEVCPFTQEQPGSMQMVCVESAKNLVVRKLEKTTTSNK